MSPEIYTTPSGIAVERTHTKIPFKRGLDALLRKLDSQRGIYLSSGYEFPGRYSRWDIAAVAPLLELSARDREVTFTPLNARGEIFNRLLEPVLASHPDWDSFALENGKLRGILKPLPPLFPEEQRSKQPSAFTIIRALIAEFNHPLASRLSLVGAFGFDLLFRFDPIRLGCRAPNTTTCACSCATRSISWIARRSRSNATPTTSPAARTPPAVEFNQRREAHSRARQEAQEAARPRPSPAIMSRKSTWPTCEKVREGMRRGDYYEVVLRQTFSTPYSGSHAELFGRIQKASPSPYEFFLQFGDEQLIGASPEMFVRAEGRRIRSCPISGTARRTGDAMRDAANIKELLNSLKEESELTMCTDVDRNDKSRVCAPGSVRVLDRRLIESYAGVFHTVDHVEGMLADGFDSLDAFLTHMWSVTMIGAPKKWAAQAIEDLEKDARGWYAGSVGMISMDGEINTGITIRTIFLRDGMARYSAGATLLYDSIPEAEERETRLKATAFFRAMRAEPEAPAVYTPKSEDGRGVRLLLVDNEDCFIHTLANYVRQTGAEVITYRSGFSLDMIESLAPSLILVSPGPGRPSDFHVPELVRRAAQLEVPVFGVCLGLQGMVEAFGGELGVLDYPMHGKPSLVRHSGVGVFEGLPSSFRVGRYHSLYAVRESLPSCLEITAESDDGVIMGLRHRDLPMEAVQFHPESILTLDGQCGLMLMENVVKVLGHMPVSTGANRT